MMYSPDSLFLSLCGVVETNCTFFPFKRNKIYFKKVLYRDNKKYKEKRNCCTFWGVFIWLTEPVEEQNRETAQKKKPCPKQGASTTLLMASSKDCKGEDENSLLCNCHQTFRSCSLSWKWELYTWLFDEKNDHPPLLGVFSGESETLKLTLFFGVRAHSEARREKKQWGQSPTD